jgi:glyoxylase-like metal-dependent hydrolase (beta-lactamase superfamily II)
MVINIFNGFTCDARWPSKLKTGLVCTLVETNQGLVLIDTGPGIEDYARPHWMMNLFRVVTKVLFDPNETAVKQVIRLGYKPEDIKHIILTHMHFDHCGGLPDFPWAQVHVHKREFDSFTKKSQRWSDVAYIRRHISNVKEWHLYETKDDAWYRLHAIQLPFNPEMWLVPLHGHSWGHCGVAVKLEKGWFFNAGDAGAVYNNSSHTWLIKMVLGPHDPMLRKFMADHPEIIMVNSHMFPEWFDNNVRINGSFSDTRPDCYLKARS